MRRAVLSVISLVPLGLALVQDAPKKKPEPTNFAPIAFFNQKCTYCHATDGKGYPEDMGDRYTNDALLDRLSEMSDEKARAPLSEKELGVLASWFRSLMKKEPYIAWVSKKEGVLTFETTRGAVLTTNIGAPKQVKDSWTLAIPSNKSTADVVLTVIQDKSKTTLKLSEAALSHRAE